MKIKHLINGLLAALLLATPSCSNDELVKTDGGQPEINADGTRTLKFQFDGLSLATAETKAGNTIATDDENLVDDMVMVLTANESSVLKHEVWHYSKDNLDEPDGVNKLLLTQNGKKLTAVIKTKLHPEGDMHLMIFTNGLTMEKADGSPVLLPEYTDLATLKDVGTYTITHKKDDGTYGPVKLDPATEPIKTPLPMGMFIDIPQNSLSFNLPIGRMVSRFDLQNRLDNLRVISITPRNAAKMIAEKDEASTRIDKMPATTVYTGTDFESDEAIASQTAGPLFYTFPSDLDKSGQQPMMFEVKAKYRDGAGNWLDRTYHLNLTRDGKPVDIRQNYRYTLILTDVTDQILTGSILISDWSNGENLDGEMNNNGAAPRLAMPTVLGTNSYLAPVTNQNILTAIGPANNTSVRLMVTNYTTDLESGATTTDNVGSNLSFDIIPMDGNPDNIWLNAPTFELTDESGTTPVVPAPGGGSTPAPSESALAGRSLFASMSTKANSETKYLTCTFTSKGTVSTGGGGEVVGGESGKSEAMVTGSKSEARYTGDYPDLMIRIKNKANPTEFQTVKVISYLKVKETNEVTDKYGNPGTSASPFEIRSADDLVGIMSLPTNFNRKYIKLANDIDLSEYTFSNGFVGGAGAEFDGVINGNHHTIRNFTLKKIFDENDWSQSDDLVVSGLMACVFNGVITNLSVTGKIDVTVESSNTPSFCCVAGISPFGTGTLIHCNNHVDITVSNTLSNVTVLASGICAYGMNMNIIGCTNTGTIRSNNGYIGGIAGLVGAVEGEMALLGCANTGAILPGNGAIAGGIAGGVFNGENAFIQNNYNSQVITGGTPGGIAGAIVVEKAGQMQPITPGTAQVVDDPVNCFYKQPATPYGLSWGTAKTVAEMTASPFTDQLNELSALPTIYYGEKQSVLTALLTGNFRYNAGGYPVIRKLTDQETSNAFDAFSAGGKVDVDMKR